MAESTTVARPYAKGLFDLAREQDALAAWSEQLELLAGVVGHPEMAQLLGSPKLTIEQRADLVIGVCGEGLTEQGRNLVHLLIDNSRLQVLPEIAAQYRDLRADAERTVEARLVAAQAVDEDVRARLESALSKRLDRTVTLTAEIDESLLGGAVIRAGDLVIDGSVQGRLKRLAGAVSR
ncbi:ATP synthase subunit delta [wastewater metagenome]|uniref:ATP synthase subunit delta n=2 Tax=unclassified sequences TaxID=12908 RepID=A0A5B8R976_9ZZZZ|nr:MULTISPECIES: F0F1 ATP synthase subunit delta [Arhodomonas]MCS4504946.1 F0F1 ATP synthase subunit delta [Arhodomonas aquaeolei]QEA05091.1 ATP synthase subunit delta [uncultured organism]